MKLRLVATPHTTLLFDSPVGHTFSSRLTHLHVHSIGGNISVLFSVILSSTVDRVMNNNHQPPSVLNRPQQFFNCQPLSKSDIAQPARFRSALCASTRCASLDYFLLLAFIFPPHYVSKVCNFPFLY